MGDLGAMRRLRSLRGSFIGDDDDDDGAVSAPLSSKFKATPLPLASLSESLVSALAAIAIDLSEEEAIGRYSVFVLF